LTVLVPCADRLLLLPCPFGPLHTDVVHGFTAWESDAYNPLADDRSWNAMLDLFRMLMPGINVTEGLGDSVVAAAESTDTSTP
jgi:hypothetical protein